MVGNAEGKDGMRYAPRGRPNPVVEKGSFCIAAAALDHGHIYGMCQGLCDAGATLKWIYDPDIQKARDLRKTFPLARIASEEAEILSDPEIRLVAAAAVPDERCSLGLRVMDSGKDYFTDKTPLTTLDQLSAVQEKVRETRKKYMVYYSERLHSESAVFAGYLVQSGAVGRVIQVMGMGPHRLGTGRPPWFFQKEKYGGILCDIGSHQIEQFLFYSGATDARVVRSQVANYNHPQYPELEDFGDAVLVADNGATGYFRVDWFTPDGLSVWGDGRTFILGTKGYIELRKYVNVAMNDRGDHVFLVNGEKEEHFDVKDQVGYPFFGQLILDCMHRTSVAMTQEHAFKAAELCIRAQLQAEKVSG